MSDRTAIEWTEATWNPVTGCSKVSPGCKFCYAERLSLRFGWSKKPWLQEHAAENVQIHKNRLPLPIGWRKGRMVFVNSMSDLFHELVPDMFIAAVFAVMESTPQHTYQILTKRPERMKRLLSHPAFFAGYVRKAGYDALGSKYIARNPGWPLPNVWLGVSAENQHWADERIPMLLETPAAVRFVSAEPLLGQIDFNSWPKRMWLQTVGDDGCATRPGLDWVIVGGESGPSARAMDPEWARSIRDQCVDARQRHSARFFFKQWGGRTPKSGGRLLDGRTWDEMPRQVA